MGEALRSFLITIMKIQNCVKKALNEKTSSKAKPNGIWFGFEFKKTKPCLVCFSVDFKDIKLFELLLFGVHIT